MALAVRGQWHTHRKSPDDPIAFLGQHGQTDPYYWPGRLSLLHPRKEREHRVLVKEQLAMGHFSSRNIADAPLARELLGSGVFHFGCYTEASAEKGPQDDQAIAPRTLAALLQADDHRPSRQWQQR
jgi:hypothetical protein